MILLIKYNGILKCRLRHIHIFVYLDFKTTKFHMLYEVWNDKWSLRLECLDV